MATPHEPVEGRATSAAMDTFEPIVAILERWRLLTIAPLAIGTLTLGIAFIVTPTFTAKTTFLPPQTQSNSASAALASLGAAAALAGNLSGIKTPGDQYIGLLQSVTISDRIINKFDLRALYEKEFFVDTRKVLSNKVQFIHSKKEGLISIEVDDQDPQRAANIANAYVEELRTLAGELALTEAQQRRAFLEAQLKPVREKLAQAQQALQKSGITSEAIKAEPKAAAESYAKIKAELTAAEIRLQAMRGYFSPNSAEYQQAELTTSALRAQLSRTENNSTSNQESADYISRYRDYKYYEALFEQFSRQYELARIDESREGPPIQVIDKATKPERKSKPKRAVLAVIATLGSAFLLTLFITARAAWRHSAQSPAVAARRARMRSALRRQ